MKILHLSKRDSGGGAADGFVRIHKALLGQGVDSVAYVMRRRRHDVPSFSAPSLLSAFQGYRWMLGRAWAKRRRFAQKPVGVYDFDAEGNFPAEPIIRHALGLASRWDLVLVHWSGGFVNPESVRRIADALGARVALWQVDMAHATGGCHSTRGCEKYRHGCGACPLLKSDDPGDVSARQSAERRRAWEAARPIIYAPSGWSARQAQASSVLRGMELHVIPIPLDLEILKPGSSRDARVVLGLPAEGRVLLVRGIDPAIPYKGFAVFTEALRHLDGLLAASGSRLHVAVVGEPGLVPADLRNIACTDLGPLRGDAALAAAYQACDFFVSPSTNDAGPMMVGEAMSCGRPVVAFPVGSAVDLVEDGMNGRIVPAIGSVAGLAEALQNYVVMDGSQLSLEQQASSRIARKVLSPEYFREQIKASVTK